MENYLRTIELELIIHQKDYELSVKDAALAVKNKEIEEKNNTIKQLTEKLQQFQSQYHDYKATRTKIIDDQRAKNLELQEKLDTLRSLSRVDRATIMELRDKLRVKDDKIEELSTKLAEVLVGRDAFKTAHCSEVESLEEDKNELINKLGEALTENVKYKDKVEDLESIIEGQKKQIVDLENGIEKLKDILSSTSDKAVSKGPDKMPDYEGFRKIADEAQRKMMEELKKWDNEKINNINRKLSIPAFKLPDDYVKGILEAFFNE